MVSQLLQWIPESSAASAFPCWALVSSLFQTLSLKTYLPILLIHPPCSPSSPPPPCSPSMHPRSHLSLLPLFATLAPFLPFHVVFTEHLLWSRPRIQ